MALRQLVEAAFFLSQILPFSNRFQFSFVNIFATFKVYDSILNDEDQHVFDGLIIKSKV